MVITIVEEKQRKVSLTSTEIETIIDILQHQAHNLFTFLNCDNIIKKLNNALGKSQ